MRLTVLGCFGGSVQDMRPTSFLINGTIAIDAGAITTALSLQEQSRISHIFFSHAHIDHLATLPFLLDNLFSTVNLPIALYGPPHAMECLKKHLFNNQLWPDFTGFANERTAIVSMRTLAPNETVEVEGVRLTSAPMDHTVECYGYLADDGAAAAFLFGDTRSVDGALPLIQGTDRLEMVVLEASFPNRMQEIASASKHLTPLDFSREVKKLPKEARVFATHMKPECLGEIQQEIADLGLTGVSLLEQGATYRLGEGAVNFGIDSSMHGDLT